MEAPVRANFTARTLAPALCVISLALGACSSGADGVRQGRGASGPVTPATSFQKYSMPSACTLAIFPDKSLLMGGELEIKSRTSSSGQAECDTATALRGSKASFVVVTVYASSSPSSEVDFIRARIKDGKCRTIAQVGDASCISTDDGTADMEVARGNVRVGVSFRLASLQDPAKINSYANKYAAAVSESIRPS